MSGEQRRAKDSRRGKRRGGVKREAVAEDCIGGATRAEGNGGGKGGEERRREERRERRDGGEGGEGG